MEVIKMAVTAFDLETPGFSSPADLQMTFDLWLQQESEAD